MEVTLSTVIALVVGLLIGFIPKAITVIKAIASKGETISLKLSTAFADTAKTFTDVNEAIKNDDKIDGNELKEIMDQGKKAILSFKDAIVEIKPHI